MAVVAVRRSSNPTGVYPSLPTPKIATVTCAAGGIHCEVRCRKCPVGWYNVRQANPCYQLNRAKKQVLVSVPQGHCLQVVAHVLDRTYIHGQSRMPRACINEKPGFGPCGAIRPWAPTPPVPAGATLGAVLGAPQGHSAGSPCGTPDGCAA